MKILKQNVGVDMAKNDFVSTIVVLLEGQTVSIIRTRKFKNSKLGIIEFFEWINKYRDQTLPMHITMEATGVYYEELAYALFDTPDVIIHVLLPNTAKKYFESLNVKTKTDKVDSRVLGQMGVERTLNPWTLTSKIYRVLRTLTREKEQLIDERTKVKNQLHAETHSAQPYKPSVTRFKNRIKYLNNQIDSVKKEVEKIVSKDEYLSNKIKKIETVPGLGFMTIVGVIAETSGFTNTNSIKQLTSYCGYDVAIKESGNWNGKAKISKKGNSHIRRLMHMASLSSIKLNYSPFLRPLFCILN